MTHSWDIKIFPGIWMEMLVSMFSDRDVVVEWLDFIPDSVKIWPVRMAPCGIDL